MSDSEFENVPWSPLTEKLKLLLGCVQKSPDIGDHLGHQMIFFGDDTQLTLQPPVSPNIVFKADASAPIGPTLGLSEAGLDALNDFTDLIMNLKLKGKISRKSPQKMVEKLIREFLGVVKKQTPEYALKPLVSKRGRGMFRYRNRILFLNDSLDEPNPNDLKIKEAIRNSLRALVAGIITWKVHIPIQFLELKDIDNLNIGGVSFLPIRTTWENISRMLVPNNKNLSTVDVSNFYTTAEYVTAFEKSASTVAEVEINCDEAILDHFAKEKVRTSLNLLMCFVKHLFGGDCRTYIGLPSEISDKPNRFVGWSIMPNRFTASIESPRALFSYELTKDNLDNLRSHFAFDTLSDLIAKRNRGEILNQLEQSVVASIDWLGQGMTEAKPPQQILHYSIVLESLLAGPDEKEGLTEKLAQRTAILLGNTKEMRIEILKITRKLYKIRSEIIHNGRTNVTSTELAEFEWLAFKILVNIAGRLEEWKRHKDITNSVDTQLMELTLPN